ncbi:sigma-70 family RNA polymerase sigma factor [bacterium]|nr:sigma-70 family RNA polymerase sigma factor [bacterium]
MTNFCKNEKRMAYLTKEAKTHPETWVEDVVDKFVFDADKNDPNYEEKLEKFQYIMDFQIDWYHPSKNRVYAYDLENNTYIYLDREMFLLYMRPYWRDKKEEQRHRQMMVSLDELHDLYELELDEHGHLITKDNYYQFSYEEDMDEDDANIVLHNALEQALSELKPDYRKIWEMLVENKSTVEIAKIQGVSQPNIVKKIKRLKEKIKKFL